MQRVPSVIVFSPTIGPCVKQKQLTFFLEKEDWNISLVAEWDPASQKTKMSIYTGISSKESNNHDLDFTPRYILSFSG